MEFLVRIEVRLPPDMEPQRREKLTAAEAQRGRELLASGALKRIWRVPARLANVSLYDTPDATTLHSLLTSLPLWPWMEVGVQALAVHPLESDRMR